jgi:glycosyltransferase involved in cell wall biosynthesis
MLNVGLSGINRYLFSELKKREWEFHVIDVPFPQAARLKAMVSTFRPDMTAWKKRFDQEISGLYKSCDVFLQRTRFCEKMIRKLEGRFDVILQISGMFAPSLHCSALKTPYVTFNDYTMALSIKYPEWAPHPSEQEKWFGLEKDLYENATYIFATSENTRRSFISDYGVRSEKVIRVSYGVALEDIKEGDKIYDGKTILFVGFDFKRKGGYVLLEAFEEVRKIIKDARLVIVGPNKDYYPIDRPGVKMIGSAEDKGLLRILYQQASLFVMPSLCEPFGLVFLEAMGYKLPCIGTAVDAMSEIIQDEKTGFLVPPGDVHSLAERMLLLLNDRELSKEMGNEGFRQLKQKFRWEDMGDKIDIFLTKCIESR